MALFASKYEKNITLDTILNCKKICLSVHYLSAILSCLSVNASIIIMIVRINSKSIITRAIIEVQKRDLVWKIIVFTRSLSFQLIWIVSADVALEA